MLHIDGVSEIRQARGLPVYTMGSATTRGLRRSASACYVLKSVVSLMWYVKFGYHIDYTACQPLPEACIGQLLLGTL